MSARIRHLRPDRSLIAIVMMAMVGLGLTAGPEARASSGSAHAGHRCKCGMDCGATCCCAPEKPVKSKPVPRQSAGLAPVSKVQAGPCVASAPCGGRLPTGAGAIARMVEPADRTALAVREQPSVGSLLEPPASDRLEVPPGSRIEEPPERLDDV